MDFNTVEKNLNNSINAIKQANHKKSHFRAVANVAKLFNRNFNHKKPEDLAQNIQDSQFKIRQQSHISNNSIHANRNIDNNSFEIIQHQISQNNLDNPVTSKNHQNEIALEAETERDSFYEFLEDEVDNDFEDKNQSRITTNGTKLQQQIRDEDQKQIIKNYSQNLRRTDLRSVESVTRFVEKQKQQYGFVILMDRQVRNDIVDRQINQFLNERPPLPPTSEHPKTQYSIEQLKTQSSKNISNGNIQTGISNKNNEQDSSRNNDLSKQINQNSNLMKLLKNSGGANNILKTFINKDNDASVLMSRQNSINNQITTNNANSLQQKVEALQMQKTIQALNQQQEQDNFDHTLQPENFFQSLFKKKLNSYQNEPRKQPNVSSTVIENISLQEKLRKQIEDLIEKKQRDGH
eukprot:403355487